MSNSERGYSSDQPHGALMRLVTGQTLRDLESVRDDVADKLTTAQAVAEQLKSGSSEEVVKALKVIRWG